MGQTRLKLSQTSEFILIYLKDTNANLNLVDIYRNFYKFSSLNTIKIYANCNGTVGLEIYNMDNGAGVRGLILSTSFSGAGGNLQEVNWSISSLSPGLYLLKIIVGSLTQVYDLAIYLTN